MTTPRYAKLVAQLLTQGPIDVPPPSTQARDAAVDAIAIALEGRRRRRQRARLARIGIGVAAVAASAAFATMQLRAGRSTPVAATPAAALSPLTLADGTPLAKGSHIAARAEGGASITLSTGTKLSLDEHAQVAFDGDANAQVFAVSRGSVRAEVAKLSPRQRFVVRTEDAEVEVRGTIFTVSHAAARADCGAGTTTRVAVTEGVVLVRHGGKEELVAAGERWPHQCNEDASATPLTLGSATRRADVAPHAPRVAPTPREVDSPSQLAEQNDMFARAVAARRSGNAALATSLLDDLLRRFPNGPLAESAAAERIRVARTSDPAGAKAFAQEYLRRYPQGFARAEATSVLESAR